MDDGAKRFREMVAEMEESHRTMLTRAGYPPIPDWFVGDCEVRRRERWWYHCYCKENGLWPFPARRDG